MKRNLFSILFITLSVCSALPACAGFTLFDGNTKRDYRDYGLEQRANYRKSRTLNKVIQSEKDAEILYRLKEDDKRKGKVLKKKETKTKELFH